MNYSTTAQVASGLVRTGISPTTFVVTDPWPVDRTHTPPSIAPPAAKGMKGVKA